ncbi:hypothetical protein ACR6C2_34620 [Streptomyces sp. INA 01156]
MVAVSGPTAAHRRDRVPQRPGQASSGILVISSVFGDRSSRTVTKAEATRATAGSSSRAS